jgi:hypothetical protein
MNYLQHRSYAPRYLDAIEKQDEIRKWLASLSWTHFVTITFNEQTTMLSARRLLRQFHYELDRQLFGKRFLKRPPEGRTFFIAFPEVAAALHWHALFRVDPAVTERFEQNIAYTLKAAAKAASCDVQRINSDADTQRIISYITKDAWQQRSIETFIVSSEFIRRGATVNSTTDDTTSELAFSIR